MANQEELDILRQGVDEWNKWKKQNFHVHPDLSHADLSHADLRGVNFHYVDLSHANLSEANLNNALIEEAIFYMVNLSKATLHSANLYDTDFSKAKFSDASLVSAICTGIQLNDADFTNASLDGTSFYGGSIEGANLEKASLTYTLFKNTTFSHANFCNAVLEEASFDNIDLRMVKGLETVKHFRPSSIGTDTLERSHGDIPEVFLRGIGLSDTFIEYVHALVKKPIDFYTCFISYSNKDEIFAKRLYNDLQSEGVRCWFAPEDMKIGDKIRHRINESIRKYDKLLLILSKHSIASTWVAYEVERALSKEPAGAQNVLYPIRLDKTILTCEEDWAKDIKDTRHIGNFERWKTNHDAYQDSFKCLLDALKAESTTSKESR